MHKLLSEKLKKIIKKKTVVDKITLELNSGEIVGLLGPNGAGKTTTFYMICGLIKPTEGKVFLDNVDITKLPLHKRAKIGIGYLPQESTIFKELSIEENLILAAEASNLSAEERDRVVEKMLELFDIEPIRKRLGINVSGGERRRTEIARALINKPKFLLLDEPFAGVDPMAVAEIQRIINSLKSQGIGILITDHNVRETLSICDRAYVIKEGKVLAEGKSEQIANNPIVKTHYLGEEFKF
jgi:lipopolysaccharide export system ATP-binding protein